MIILIIVLSNDYNNDYLTVNWLLLIINYGQLIISYFVCTLTCSHKHRVCLLPLDCIREGWITVSTVEICGEERCLIYNLTVLLLSDNLKRIQWGSSSDRKEDRLHEHSHLKSAQVTPYHSLFWKPYMKDLETECWEAQLSWCSAIKMSLLD